MPLSAEEVVLKLLGLTRNGGQLAESMLVEADKARACIKNKTLFIYPPGKPETIQLPLKYMGPTTWKATVAGVEFFVKRMRFSSEDQLVSMVELANTLHIPFFARVLAAARCKSKYYVVFTEAFDMTLKQWLNQPDRTEVQPSEYVSALLQIMVALAAVHSQNLVHGAIKTSNIVVKPSFQRRIGTWKMLVGHTLLNIKKTTATFALNNLVRAKTFESKRSVRPPPCEVRDVLRIFASGRGIISKLYKGTRVLYMLARRGNMDAPTFLQDPEVLKVLKDMSGLAFTYTPEVSNANIKNLVRPNTANNANVNRNNNQNDTYATEVVSQGYHPYDGTADCSKKGSGLPTSSTLRMMARDAKHRLNIASHARSLFGI
jgi:serine/threonine protein kinase